MESVDYLQALRRSWWLIILVTLASTLGGYIVYHAATPLYQSSIRLVVATAAPGADAASSLALANAQAQALAQIAPTPPAVADAAAKAGHAGVAPAVSAGADATQPFVSISVVYPDPAVAQSVADSYVKTITATKTRLLGGSSASFIVTSLAPASDPGAPISPSRKRDIGLGLAVGFVLGLALAILRESLNRAVRDTDELQRITNLTVLGTVPRDLPNEQVPARSHPRSARAEAYRQIRTTLLNASSRRPLTIAVTSATLGDGKTSVATNVAVVFSRAGHRVALVDADLRRPRVADFLDLAPPAGLTEVLSGIVDLDDALTEMDGGQLAVLTAGAIPSNPSEALGSEAMDTVLRRLAANHEFVIVDTPPVLPVADALVLAPKVDGVVLVARLGSTTRDRLRNAKAAIDRVHATAIGVVPNQARFGSDRDYRYPYRYTPTGRGEDPTTTAVPMEDGSRAPREAVPINGDETAGRHARTVRSRPSPSGTSGGDVGMLRSSDE